ncbi:MAG: hypothetical protein WCT85_01580 [Parachlamydiales bacterium]|jgi:hypothetical protein
MTLEIQCRLIKHSFAKVEIGRTATLKSRYATLWLSKWQVNDKFYHVTVLNTEVSPNANPNQTFRQISSVFSGRDKTSYYQIDDLSKKNPRNLKVDGDDFNYQIGLNNFQNLERYVPFENFDSESVLIDLIKKILSK